MASILRQIVAGPRARHSDSGLDLCYVTDKIIATSGPSAKYPSLAYRNPLGDLVKFLDKQHGENWCIWEFRAEGTGYPDAEVYGRIQHFPWPDHHPPPFKLIPRIMASMRNWLQHAEVKDRVAVMHCKAGKGRTGTTTCSYLMSEEGWTLEEALKRFTDRRMRPGFGAGVSIPSQLRWLSYVDRWAKNGKVYIERPVEVLEIHVFGLRDGVKISIEGFESEGKVIKVLHVFRKHERDDYNADHPDETIAKEQEDGAKLTHIVADVWRSYKKSSPSSATTLNEDKKEGSTDGSKDPSPAVSRKGTNTLATTNSTDQAGKNVILRPTKPILLPTSDINLAAERRSRAGYGLTMVTSVAHVWFNCFFEGDGPENLSSGKKDGADENGVFSIEWEPMDGIKGSSRKGVRAFDSINVIWRFVPSQPAVRIDEPALDEPVRDESAADWKGSGAVHQGENETESDKLTVSTPANLGLRAESADSADVSKANTPRSASPVSSEDTADKRKAKVAERIRSAASKSKDASAGGNSSDEDEGVNVGVVLPEEASATISTAAEPEGKEKPATTEST